MAPKSTFGRLRTFGRGNSVPINTANINLNDHSIATVSKTANTHLSNTSPNGGVIEGGNFIFHTDAKNAKGTTAVSSSSGSGKVVNPSNLRPSHWAVSRSPGMRMDTTSSTSQSSWVNLFTEPQEGNAKAMRNKNIMLILMCVVYMVVCGGIGYALGQYREAVVL